MSTVTRGKKMPQARNVTGAYCCISITSEAALQVPQENEEFDPTPLGHEATHLMPACAGPEPWITFSRCKAAPLSCPPAERNRGSGALLESLSTDVIANLRPMLFSVNHPPRSPMKTLHFTFPACILETLRTIIKFFGMCIENWKQTKAEFSLETD